MAAQNIKPYPGIFPLIATRSLDQLRRIGEVQRIGAKSTNSAVLVKPKPPYNRGYTLWANPSYGNYTGAYRDAFGDYDSSTIDIDHVYAKEKAKAYGYAYVLMMPLCRSVNRSAGEIEKRFKKVATINRKSEHHVEYPFKGMDLFCFEKVKRTKEIVHDPDTKYSDYNYVYFEDYNLFQKKNGEYIKWAISGEKDSFLSWKK